ncbi:MAG TPA: HNH endonuclease signature motif containing protein [Nocardioides sp.]|uniref:HNH endonuclease signature motif containing protein n=1 Tax=Nocardioides sp. TaxID=35761 RepID=UPI002B8A48B0|nr:HNH endonuclease signature motif containing protein [Nocardioides sp.]HQR28355.1 HNH endonuclease signature motif containing protein [Nocardioides sp.]
MSILLEPTGVTPGSPAAVLGVARAARAAELAAGAQVLHAAVEWAGMHQPLDPREAVELGVFGGCVPVAGEGCPLISEFAVAEFAAAVGLTTEAGKRLVGHAVELAHRLPRTWQLVVEGVLAAWKARHVAEHTLLLSREAAGFVDAHVASVAGKVGPVQLDRIVLEAKRRHMPQVLESEHDPDTARDRRGVWVRTGQVSYDGVVGVEAHLDLGDALDLDDALADLAQQLKLAGSAEPLEVRRAAALGELARHQLTLTLADPARDETGEALGLRNPRRRPKAAARPVTLYLHLSEAALSGAGGQVGRCENTRTPIDVQVVRDWCGPGSTVTVKPVIDLRAHVGVAQYEVPDRLKERVVLRDVQCVFPWCTRPARTACDCDHVIAHGTGGPTCTCNLAALCRHHHRVKTHTAWRYTMVEEGVFVWTSPHGYVFLRDRSSTTDVTPTGNVPHPGCPPDAGDHAGTDPPDR